MSVDTPGTDGRERTAAPSCGICGGTAPANDDGRFLACYPTDGVEGPSLAARDGFLALCGTCAADVAELTVSWTEQESPSVGADRTIARGYRAVADDCSFCNDEIGDGPTLGVESWVRDHPTHTDPDQPAYREPDDHAQYALCDACVPVFEEFLRGVRTDRKG